MADKKKDNKRDDKENDKKNEKDGKKNAPILIPLKKSKPKGGTGAGAGKRGGRGGRSSRGSRGGRGGRGGYSRGRGRGGYGNLGDRGTLNEFGDWNNQKVDDVLTDLFGKPEHIGQNSSSENNNNNNEDEMNDFNIWSLKIADDIKHNYYGRFLNHLNMHAPDKPPKIDHKEKAHHLDITKELSVII